MLKLNARRKFRLQKVLEVRQLVEKEKQKEVAAAVQALKIGQTALEKLESKRDEFTQSMNEIAIAAVSQLSDNQDYLLTLNEELSHQREEISVLEKNVEARRKDLVRATKEREVLEKLKERRMKQIIHEKDRVEQAFLDEIALQRKPDAIAESGGIGNV